MELGFRLAGASAVLALTFGAVAIAAPSTQHVADASTTEPVAPPVEQAAPATMAITPVDTGPSVFGPQYDLSYRPNPADLWRHHLAADPAQAVMPVRNWCPTAATLQPLPYSARYEIALRRLYDFTPTKAKFDEAVAGIEDIRSQVEKVFPRSFGYDRSDEDTPRIVDIGTQVQHLVLHYTESERRDFSGYAFAKLVANMGTGVGYNYYINDTDTASNIYYTSGEFVHHVKGHSVGAFGVEVGACSQAGITPLQWENLIYTVANFMQANNIVTKDVPVGAVVNRFVVGHREIAGELGHADFPKVMTEPFRWRLIGFLVQELGYKL